MSHRAPWVSVLVTVSVLCLVDGLAAADRVVLSIDLPRGLPTGLRIPLQARVEGAATPGAVLVARHEALGEGNVVVQCQSDGRAAWLLAAIGKGQADGKRIRVTGVVKTDRGGETGVRFVAAPGGMECRDGDRKVMFYHREPRSLDNGTHVAANYFHPLYGLGGEVLTQDFPKDHPHHHGIFWAWHQLLVGKVRAGDPWVNKDFLPVVREVVVAELGPVFATLSTRVEWTSKHIVDRNGRQRPIVEEKGRFRVFHSVGDVRHIDFRIRLTALLDEVKIGGSENVKGYSGFTVRVKPPRQMAIHDRRGLLKQDAVGSQSPWADISGRFGDGEAVSGLSILCDKRLPEFPPKWLLRYYGMQNVAYPGREAVPLQRNRPLVLRHRLVIHKGDRSVARSNDQQAAFEVSPVRD
ncbi:MAG TPA: hypothetical protein DCE47_19660 [Planctomycetaceae bacterium]|nr:hypothetical protein [Planctomycetaceae bacterium]